MPVAGRPMPGGAMNRLGRGTALVKIYILQSLGDLIEVSTRMFLLVALQQQILLRHSIGSG